MAKKRVGARGRTWAAAILLGFVLIAASVIQRRVFGMRQALEITRLQHELQALESAKRKLESEIEEARDLGRIRPVVEQRLGMRIPHDSLVVPIPRSAKNAPTQ